jgi:hypothetical protein
MNDLVISLNNNILKLSYVYKEGLKTLEKVVDNSVVEDTKIINLEEYSKVLSEMIDELSGKSRKKVKLSFVSHPQDSYLRFVTVNKNESDIENFILSEIKTKFDDFDSDNSYYSYQKIAPFVYQFVGVKKEHLNNYLEISNFLKLEIKGIYPWIMLLPRYLDVNEPSIFVSKINDEQVVALSELNGIFYSGIFEEERSSEELNKLVKQLSIYKRNQPISKIYTLNYDDFKIQNGYEVFKIDTPNQELDNAKGFELNLLVNYMVDLDPELGRTQANLINLFPLPVASKSKVPMVYVGAAAVAVSLVLVIGGALFFFTGQGVSGRDSNNNVEETDSVLSDNSNGHSEQTEVNEQETNENTDEVGEGLKKEDLKIRIENGAGINGAAGTTEEFLAGLGYDILEIDTAEVPVGDTIFRFKEGNTEYLEMISEDAKEKIPSYVVEENLDEREEYDLLIILGSSITL